MRLTSTHAARMGIRLLDLWYAKRSGRIVSHPPDAPPDGCKRKRGGKRYGYRAMDFFELMGKTVAYARGNLYLCPCLPRNPGKHRMTYQELLSYLRIYTEPGATLEVHWKGVGNQPYSKAWPATHEGLNRALALASDVHLRNHPSRLELVTATERRTLLTRFGLCG